MKNQLFEWQSASSTHIGHVRLQNEDAFLDNAEDGIWVVADGMGGHDAGELASQLIIDTLEFMQKSHSMERAMEDIETALQEVNQRLLRLGEEFDRVNGSTVVVTVIYHDLCGYLWAGDSRLYRLRNNQLSQLTKDHSQAEVYIDMGMLTREEAANHASSNMLTRAIGTEKKLTVDSGVTELEHGDRLLLSSDGLDKHVSVAEIEKILCEGSPQTAMESLVSCALKGGGSDNITVSVIDIQQREDKNENTGIYNIFDGNNNLENTLSE